MRWDGWVADPKRVYAHRGRQGSLVHLRSAKHENTNTPDLNNGGRGRAQWPGRKLPPANINPPYVWLDTQKIGHFSLIK